MCLVVAAALVSLPAAAQAAAPPNDDFASAQSVRIGDRVTGTTTDATVEAGEPAPSSALLTRSIWYRVTTSVTEPVRVDSCSSPRFAETTVYTGAAVGALTEVAHTGGGCGAGARLYFTATAGTSYYVRLAAYGDFNGEVVLNVARPQAPANDNFENAQPVGRPARITASTVDATVQPGEPQPTIFGGSGHSVWYRLKATTSDSVVVSTCSNGVGCNAMVAVYTGDSVGRLTEVGREGGPTGQRTTMLFITTPGTSYYIAVRGYGDGAGEFTLDVSEQTPPSPPPNLQPPPSPTCPFVFAPDMVSYSGTHSGGGAVCVAVSKDFSDVVWFHALDVPADTCKIPWRVEKMEVPTPIVDRRFSYGSSYSRITGAFSASRGASGTFKTKVPMGGPLSFCTSLMLTWTATTIATPPWLDATPPALRLGGAVVQRPLRRRGIAVAVRCPKEACTASATATVAGVRLKTAKLVKVRKGSGRTLRLALSARSLRAIGAALRSKPTISTRVTVVATDAVGNRASASRTITMRR